MAKGIKTGGRKKGTANKLTSEMRTNLKAINDEEILNLIIFVQFVIHTKYYYMIENCFNNFILE